MLISRDELLLQADVVDLNDTDVRTMTFSCGRSEVSGRSDYSA